ncbi:MAG: DUF4398 domain-containing protein [Bdellovibrionia bacterium]
MLKKREIRVPQKSTGSRFAFSKPLAVLSTLTVLVSCSLFKTRPVQEMSDTAAAMKAAKEAQADIIAPVLYREANEWWQKAKAEYKYKNFEEAESYAKKARKLAEQAEFEVLKNPGQRAESAIDSGAPANPEPAPTESPYAYPTPTGTPYERAVQNPSGGGGDNTGGGSGGSGSGGNNPTHIQVPSPGTP